MDTELKLLTNKLLKKESPDQIVNDFKKYINQNSDHIIFNWHPLGFVHSKLCNIPNIGDLRLHVWLDGFRSTQLPHMPIHDHIFNVNSFILTGTVTNHIYELGTDNGHKYRAFEAEYNNGGSLLIPTEVLLTCSLKSSTVHNKGDFYIVEKGIFHETTVEEGNFAATLVIATEKDETKQPKILGPIKNDEYFYSREKCNEPILTILNDRIY
ncbi:hypothetical protein [Bacillus sp. V59.32b]|uniref:hypothetical protein n=1 Tax=Bacillus sp. V59.32b TaxID=1758642 RepID=UPI000E3EB23E|nr:hypothetical protein [Bacillus sp. V59.32b]RFU60822.1 hypothetical protein D0463_16015 [Bacillus sp. V59.32b]